MANKKEKEILSTSHWPANTYEIKSERENTC